MCKNSYCCVDCDSVLTIYSTADNKTGRITSPNYPQRYGPNLRCLYYLIGLPSERVQISFIDFEVKGVLPRCVRHSKHSTLCYHKHRSIGRRYNDNINMLLQPAELVWDLPHPAQLQCHELCRRLETGHLLWLVPAYGTSSHHHFVTSILLQLLNVNSTFLFDNAFNSHC